MANRVFISSLTESAGGGRVDHFRGAPDDLEDRLDGLGSRRMDAGARQLPPSVSISTLQQGTLA